MLLSIRNLHCAEKVGEQLSQRERLCSGRKWNKGNIEIHEVSSSWHGSPRACRPNNTNHRGYCGECNCLCSSFSSLPVTLTGLHIWNKCVCSILWVQHLQSHLESRTPRATGHKPGRLLDSIELVLSRYPTKCITAKMPPSSSSQTKESCYKLKLDFPPKSPSSHHHIDCKNIPLILVQKKICGAAWLSQQG